MSYVLPFGLLAVANFCYIFLKAWQQRNVAHLHYGWAMATNFFLVLTEVFVMGSIAIAAVNASAVMLAYTVVAMAIGGGSGCILSMYLHSKYLTRR